MSTISDLLKQARARMTELEPLVEEYKRLQGVVKTLETSSEPQAARTPGKRRSNGRRAGSDSDSSGRREQALAFIADHPGAKVSQIAESMGIGSTYLYRLLPKLEREGELRKSGSGYFLPE